MTAILSPGQGSQTPAMFAPWLELAGVDDYLGSLSEAAGIDLIAHGTVSDAETIRDTAVAQPLIVAASLLSWRVLTGTVGNRAAQAPRAVDVVAGHSVGEFAAAVVAGVLTDAEAVRLVGHRARAMASAAALEPTGMSAVLGGDPDEVIAAIAAAGLSPANINGGGQIVAAGNLAGLQALAAQPPAKARVVPLKVAGAFHTDFMEPARAEFAAVVADATSSSPLIPLLSDLDGSTLTAPVSGGTILDRLVAQVVAPVRWDLVQRTLSERGVTSAIELLPGGVLTGLARRTLTGVTSVAIKSPSDIEQAAALLDNQPQTSGDAL